MGRAHKNRITVDVLIGMQKNQKKMYNTQITGNTIIRKENRQHKRTDFRQQIFTYLIHIKKDFLSIDTRFFTASYSMVIF